MAEDKPSDVCTASLDVDAGPAVDAELHGLDIKTLSKIRTRLAIARIGKAGVSSAVSTIGTSVVLYFCTLRVMPALATALIIITVLALFGALVTLPALLILMGPPPEPFRLLRARSHLFWALVHEKFQFKF